MIKAFDRKSLVVTLTIFSYSLILFSLFSRHFLLSNDLIGDTSGLVYIKEAIVKEHVFPQWNPYINQGLPTIADPLSSFYNPLVALAILIFPFQIALRVIIFIAIFVSGLSCYLLLKSLKVSRLISLFHSLFFISSGFLVARIIAGHFELIVSYPLIPIFFLLLIRLLKNKDIVTSIYLSLIISLFLFSGAVYLFYYASILVISTAGYIGVKAFINREIKELKIIILIVFTIGFTFLTSAIKILPMIESNSLFVKQLAPYLGSQNFYSMLYNLFLPSNNFFHYFRLSSYISNPYPWWESYAFVGIGPSLGLVLFVMNIDKIKFKYIFFFSYLAVVIVLFLMINNTWNPFYWLVKELIFLQKFRIPSRIYSFLIPILLIFSSISFDYFLVKYKLRKNFLILVLLVFFTYLSLTSYRNMLESEGKREINQNYSNLIAYLKENDPGNNFYIAQNVLFENQLPQYELVANHQKLLNSNYGFVLKNSSVFEYILLDFYNKNNKFTDIIPKYFIYPCKISIPQVFKANLVKRNDDTCLYRSTNFSSLAYISNYEDSLSIESGLKGYNIETKYGINSITTKITGINDKTKLTVLESNYPGWQLKVDGKKEKLLSNKYLAAKIKPGKHVYNFSFQSQPFIIGLLTTTITMTAGLFVICSDLKKRFKNKS